MDRRTFIKACGLGAVALAGPGLQTIGAQPARQIDLRVITYNILQNTGFGVTPRSKPFLRAAAAQMPMRLAMELELYRPDVITFQEGPAEPVLQKIAAGLGFNCVHFPSGSEVPGKKLGWPGAVLSRFKILESTNCPVVGGSRPADLFTRHFGKARLQTDAGAIELYSAHLHPSDAAIREREVTEILRAMQPDLEKRAPILFQGDLNHEPSGPEYGRWQQAGLVDSLERKSRGIDLSFKNPKPYKRVDYIWTGGSLAQATIQCEILFEGAFRTNPEDDRSFALSDHLPMLAVVRQ